ncbi:MAG: amidase family protein [Nanoarchaeota archaeon]|nr:amidase family protein [Nanoarchaeota archaeon]
MISIQKVEQIKLGKLTAEKNISDFLDKIKKENKKINAVLSVNPNALEDAKKVDAKKDKGLLAGLGVIVKSNICVQGLECNCASKVLEGWIAPYDATVIEKIEKQDGVILGMANMDEFACGGSGETSAFGACQNPAAFGKVPGGSSSGPAASVVAEFCDFALGSDTGGSNRNPASHCGIVGVKPSYGLVSRYGLIDMAMSFDQIGSLTKDVKSAGLILDIIKGRDEKDSVSFSSDKIKLGNLGKLTVGVLKKIANDDVHNLVSEKVEKAVEKYGWKVKEIDLKNIDLAIQTYYPIVYVEFFSGTRKFDGRRFGKKIDEHCGPEVLRRILGGEEISKAEYDGRYYKKALEVKEIIRKEFENAFKDVDCIIIPTVPRLPHDVGSSISTEEMYGYDVLTAPVNLAECCAVSVPAGKINNIPVGLQVICGHLQEGKMLSIAKMIEDL